MTILVSIYLGHFTEGKSKEKAENRKKIQDNLDHEIATRHDLMEIQKADFDDSLGVL